MCGVVGFFERNTRNKRETLHRMMQSLSHRGPDADGEFFYTEENGQVALGHRRLSIIDLDHASNQPFIFKDLTIVYNGEVYNFSDIRAELKSLGYEFQTQGDTEVILKAFDQWGIASVDKFRGMFAFCIYDKGKNKAYLVRDRVGVKPLYYYHNHDSFIFSSEIRALQYHSAFKKQLSQAGLNLFLQYGYIAAPYTIYADTYKLRPGYYLEYDFNSHALIENKYWDLASYYQQPKLILSDDEAVNQLEAILKDSFSLRLVSDVPVGVLLSGGIDSTLVAALLQQTSSKPLETFTIGFEQSNYDESHYAKKIAQHLGVNHHEKICTWQDAQSIINELPNIYDEPFADSSLIPTTLISQFAKKQVTVVLSGDGGDELFGGYTSYFLSAARFNKLNKMPFRKVAGKILNLIPDPLMKLYNVNYDLYNRYLKIKSILSESHLEGKYRAITRVFNQYDLTKLLNNSNIEKINHATMSNLNDLERMMLMDFNYYLPDDLLVKVDRATMFHSLEGREPLLDHKILEFAARLPARFKMEKAILKTILAKYVPPALFERKKQGFGVPVNMWLRQQLKYFTERYLNPAYLKRQDIFCSQYVAKLYNAFLNSNTNDNRIWTLLVFQMWYEKNFNELS
jgi:asparagine synthase (glutamine-hydrolysing)